ncbi:MAG: sorbosone dehydrogenase family protein [Gammaproteobacteria bacterium]|nr:sorbosone dehydrogenase family protein [Gammaproteobacteria bacterium]
MGDEGQVEGERDGGDEIFHTMILTGPMGFTEYFSSEESGSMTKRLLRTTRWLVGIGLVLSLAAIVGFTWLFFLGGVALSDRTMIWRMLRDGGIGPPSAEVVARQLVVPQGFSLSLWAKDLPSARLMVPTAAGDVILSQPRGGLVALLLADRDGDGRSDGRRNLFEGLDRPNGVDLHDGWLYIAETTSVSRVRFDEQSGAISGKLEPLITGLTGDGNHWRKTVRVGPDGRLYVGQGSTCNVCIEKDSRRATIMRFDLDVSMSAIIATGLRNPYGFDWAPWDESLYATENSRDLLGDDSPPDELNCIVNGGFYGWPFVHGRNVIDPEFGQGNEARIVEAIAPAHEFRAHNAPLGIRFLIHPGRPAGFERAALVALHGSWNRSEPDGYKVVSLHWNEDGSIEERPFLNGFRNDTGLIGRPVDVAEGPDGSLYVSDDYAGVVYRVSYEPRR